MALTFPELPPAPDSKRRAGGNPHAGPPTRQPGSRPWLSKGLESDIVDRRPPRHGMGDRSVWLPGKGWAPPTVALTPRGTGTGRPDIWMGEARTAQGARPGARYKVRQKSGFQGFGRTPRAGTLTKANVVDALLAAISARVNGGQ